MATHVRLPRWKTTPGCTPAGKRLLSAELKGRAGQLRTSIDYQIKTLMIVFGPRDR